MNKEKNEVLCLPNFNKGLMDDNLPESKVLFYPCCGEDIFDAIQYFNSFVDTFFFCDIKIRINNQTIRKIKSNLPDFDLLKSYEVFTWKKYSGYSDSRRQEASRQNIEPSLYEKKLKKTTQIWNNEKKNKQITIIWYEGDGYEVFTKEEILTQIGIFFYRGDSGGEGGSNVGWLKVEGDIGKINKHFDVVLQKLSNNGLIVTDGSNCGEKYKFLKSYCDIRKELALENLPSVRKEKNEFKCIGKITPRYGHTLVWQIEKGGVNMLNEILNV